jgi:hypothetical protein
MDEDVGTFTDYDGTKKVCTGQKDESTGFSVMLVCDWKAVYLFPIVYTGVYIGLTFVIILLINNSYK